MKAQTLPDMRVLRCLNRRTTIQIMRYINCSCKTSIIVLTCRRALAMYVTMTAENVPNLRALLKTSAKTRERRFQWVIVTPFMMRMKCKKKKETSSCCHQEIAVNIRTHRCAERKTWADSTMLPPPPSTEETLYSVAWIQSYPYKIQKVKAFFNKCE